MKRLLAVVVCIAMILPLLPVTGMAEVVTTDVYYDFSDYAGEVSYKSFSFGTACDYGVSDESRGTSIKRYCTAEGEHINANFEMYSDCVFGFSYCPNDSNLWVSIGAKGSSGDWDETALRNIILLSGADIKIDTTVIYKGELGKWVDVAIGIDFTNHRLAIYANGNLIRYTTISEDVTMTKYFNFNIAKDKKSDTYVEGTEELTKEDYASLWVDDVFAYLADGALSADIGKVNVDPAGLSEINFDFGDRVASSDWTKAVILNGEVAEFETVTTHGYVTGVKLTGLSLSEKADYTVAFPGVTYLLNTGIEDFKFNTGVANTSFEISSDDAGENFDEGTNVVIKITAENVTENIGIYNNDTLITTVSPDTASVKIALGAGKNKITAKLDSLGLASNTLEFDAVSYEIIKTLANIDFEDGTKGVLNIGAAVYVLDENGDYTYDEAGKKVSRNLSGAEIFEIAQTDSEHGKSMRIFASGSNKYSNAPYFSHPSGLGYYGVYVCEFDAKYSNNGANTFFSIKTKDSAGKDLWGNQIFTFKDGYIQANGTNVCEIADDTWYNYKAAFDMNTKTADFYIDNVLVADDVKLKTTSFTDIQYVNNTLNTVFGTDKQVYLDNYKAYFKASKFNVDVDFGKNSANNVSVDNGIINLSFDQVVDGSVLTDAVLYGSDGSQVKACFTTEDNINFTASLSGLNRSTAYTIDLSGVVTLSGLGGNVTEIKFSTEKTPVIFEAEDIISEKGGAAEGRTLFMDDNDPSKLSDATGVILDNNFMNATTFTDENKAAIYAKQEGLVLDVDALKADGKVATDAEYMIFAKASSLATEGRDSLYSYKTDAAGEGTFLNQYGGVNVGSRGYPAYYGIAEVTKSAHVEGRGYTGANGNLAWVKVANTTLKSGDKIWIVGREDAFVDKVMLVPASMEYTVTEAGAFEKETVTTYTASFVANDKVYYTIEFEPGTTQLSDRIFFTTLFKEYTAVSPREEWAAAHPDYATYFDYNPSTETQAYKWEPYTLSDSDITVNAVESNGAVPVLDSIFSNGMMLQRNENVKIYGECPVDGVTIEVSILGQTKTATVADGKWEVVLDPMEANEGTSLTVSAVGGDSITYTDVAIGEIWICMGQSNMNQRLTTIEDYEEYKADMENNNIRIFCMTEIGAYEEQSDVTNGKWKKSVPSNANNFSAIGYVMAEKLHKTLGVPVGLLFPCRGGTNINVWVSEEILRSRPEYDAIEAKYDEFDPNGTYTNDDYHNMPTSFYNNMVYPLMPYTVSGALWYQGCNNKNDDQEVYKLLFKDMVANWREGFENPDMPVISFQLAPYNDNFMSMRQTQFELAREDENVYLVSTAYEGYTRTAKDEESGAIHPYRKSPVAKRAAHIALNNVYGNTSMGDEYYPPYGTSAYTLNNAMYVEMAHSGTGLVIDTTTFDNLEGFDVSEDGTVWADAKATIEPDGKTVKLVADSVVIPKFARYGYAKEVIEYTDRTASTTYDETKTLLRATLGGNLTNNTGYPAYAFSIASSSVEDTRGYAGGIGGNVLFEADGSEFLNADGSINDFKDNGIYLNYRYTTNKAPEFSVVSALSDANGVYGDVLKVRVVNVDSDFKFMMPNGRMDESFTMSFCYYADNNFKLNFRPYYYKPDATTTSNKILFKQKWNGLVSGDEKTSYASMKNNTYRWVSVDVAFDMENDCARIYVDNVLKDTVAIEDLDAVSYILFGFESATYKEKVETTDETTGEVTTTEVTKYHDTVGYIDNVSIIRNPDINNDEMTVKTVETLLARANGDVANIKFTTVNKAGATVATEYEDEYHGNVIRYSLPAGTTNANFYGTIGTVGASEKVTAGGNEYGNLLASDGKEFVFEIDVKFDDFNNKKVYGAINHFAKTSADATEYTRSSTINPFTITKSGALQFGNDVVAQLETGKWYSFKAVYNMGSEDTDIPQVKAYFDGRYLGEKRATNNDNEYYNVDYIGYITYNHGGTGDATSSLSVDNIRFYTTTEATVVPAYVESLVAYQNGKILGESFDDGALRVEALWKANAVESSTVTMIAARYRGNELISIATKSHAVGVDYSSIIDVTLTDEMMQDVTPEDYIKIMFTDGSYLKPFAKAVGGAR